MLLVKAMSANMVHRAAWRVSTRKTIRQKSRAIVIHPAWYVSQAMIAEQGKIGRSQGCFAFSENDIGQILQRLAPGTLLYADKV